MAFWQFWMVLPLQRSCLILGLSHRRVLFQVFEYMLVNLERLFMSFVVTVRVSLVPSSAAQIFSIG